MFPCRTSAYVRSSNTFLLRIVDEKSIMFQARSRQKFTRLTSYSCQKRGHHDISTDSVDAFYCPVIATSHYHLSGSFKKKNTQPATRCRTRSAKWPLKRETNSNVRSHRVLLKSSERGGLH